MTLVDAGTITGEQTDNLQNYFDQRLQRIKALRRRTEKGIPTFDITKVIQTYQDCPQPHWSNERELGAVAVIALAEYLSEKLEINAYFQSTLLLKSSHDHTSLTHRIVIELINPKIGDVGTMWVVHVITPDLDLAIVYDQQKLGYCHFAYNEFLDLHRLESPTRRTCRETTRATRRAYGEDASLFH